MDGVCGKVRQLWAYSAEDTLEVNDITESHGKIGSLTKNLRLVKMNSEWPEMGIRTPEDVMVDDTEDQRNHFQIRTVSTGRTLRLTPTRLLKISEQLRQLNCLELIENLHISKILIEEGDSELRLRPFANLRFLEIKCESHLRSDETPSQVLSRLLGEVFELRNLQSLQLGCDSGKSEFYAADIHFSDYHVQTVSSMDWLEELTLMKFDLSQVKMQLLVGTMPLLTSLTYVRWCYKCR